MILSQLTDSAHSAGPNPSSRAYRHAAILLPRDLRAPISRRMTRRPSRSEIGQNRRLPCTPAAACSLPKEASDLLNYFVTWR